jgi:hypothetical protein
MEARSAMITIDRVTVKTSEKGNPYAEIWSGTVRYSSKDLDWKNRIGAQVDEKHVRRDGTYLNLPPVKVVFGSDPRASVPVIPQAPNGLQAQQTTNERFEILNRKIDRVLELLQAHFK